MIQNAPLRPTLFTKRLIALKHRKGRTRRVIVAGLMLTSMVDMFSLLVIFLLQSFSNSPEVMALSSGIVLPSAISASAPIDAPLLTITEKEILVDHKSVGEIKAVLDKPDALVKKLVEMKAIWENTHRSNAFKGDVHLQADQKLSSSLVSQLIGILNSQGYGTVHLAVVNGAR